MTSTFSLQPINNNVFGRVTRCDIVTGYIIVKRFI